MKSEKFASAKNSGKIAKSSPNWETSLDVRSLRCSELSPHSAPALRRASEGAGVLGPPPQRQVLVPPNKPHLLDKLLQPLDKQLQQQLVVFLVRIFDKLLEVWCSMNLNLFWIFNFWIDNLGIQLIFSDEKCFRFWTNYFVNSWISSLVSDALDLAC